MIIILSQTFHSSSLIEIGALVKPFSRLLKTQHPKLYFLFPVVTAPHLFFFIVSQISLYKTTLNLIGWCFFLGSTHSYARKSLINLSYFISDYNNFYISSLTYCTYWCNVTIHTLLTLPRIVSVRSGFT